LAIHVNRRSLSRAQQKGRSLRTGLLEPRRAIAVAAVALA